MQATHELNNFTCWPPPTPVFESTSTFSSVSELIKNFGQCWNGIKYQNTEFSKAKFKELINAYNEQFFKPIPRYNYHGFIEKKDVPPGTEIFVRGDLHGDLKSLIENLKILREQGRLDEDYKCKPHVQFVFLGDYVDDGYNPLEVLELLMTLRMENPEQVTLILGDHDNIVRNWHLENPYYDFNFSSFMRTSAAEDRMDTDTFQLMGQLYETMPLTIFISEQSDEREYVVFTHGMFELYVDPTEMLNSSASSSQMLVSSTQRKFSSRVQELISPVISQARQTSDDEPLPGNKKSHRRKVKQQRAAKHIDLLFQKDKQRLCSTRYTWGNMIAIQEEKQGPCFESIEEGKWGLISKNVKDYFRLCSSKHQVKMMFRGHQHAKQHHEYHGKVLVSTMPVGPNTATAKSLFQEQLDIAYTFDTAYILVTASKVKDWKKIAYLRKVKEATQEIIGPCPIYSKEI